MRGKNELEQDTTNGAWMVLVAGKDRGAYEMKLMPEVPTEEMVQAFHDRYIEGADYIDKNSVEFALTLEALKAAIAAAPEVTGTPTLAKHQTCGCVVCTCDGDKCLGCGAKHCGNHPVGEIPNPLYAHPDPRIEQLEAQLAKAREGAMAAAAKICADVDIALITDSDYYYRGFDDCKRKTQEAIDAAIAAAKEK